MTSAEEPQREGRRERKKRETRERISDIATGLFLERGFDAVTLTEIAETVDVSVNTIYNYFGTKEDLFFDREAEVTERAARLVRERGPGESAADALLGQLRREIEGSGPYAGMQEGYEAFLRVATDSPALTARLFVMRGHLVDRLAEALREEADAEPDDPLPELVAQHLVGLETVVQRSAMRGLAEGEKPQVVAERARAQVDAFERLCSRVLLGYARRPKR